MNKYEKGFLVTLLLATRPKFLSASAAPVLVGSALGFAVTGSFNMLLFVLAVLSIMALHAGANVANDYFDHISGNDWVNDNVTPFSGGRRYIQEKILSPRATLYTSLGFLLIGSAIGLAIVVLTKSIFILILGLAGLLGGFFYTAPPLKLGYRGIGELVIAFLFGLLPVYGSYYLQTGYIDAAAFAPACIVSILIFLIIFVNEFPDLAADAAVNKKTLISSLGVPVSVWVYRIVLIASLPIAVGAMLVYRSMFFAWLFYLLTLPLIIRAIKFVNTKEISMPGVTQHRASQTTIMLHTVGCLAITIGFVLSGLLNLST